jgi:UDP-N-acetylglucosamine 1-carboxyvinyltransferase
MTKIAIQKTTDGVVVRNNSITIRGGKPLRGEISVRGAKNALSKEIVASLLTREKCVLKNVAEVEDLEIVSSMIKAVGGSVKRLDEHSIELHHENIHPASDSELKSIAGKSRLPVLFAGPLLHRSGEAFIPELGGCKIGKRPVDFHVNALKMLGAKVEEIEKGFHITAEKLKGAKIKLEYPSVGTTEQVLLSSVLAEGVTELSNAAIEPEIMDLIAVLQKMGAIISVDTDRVITIIGVDELHGFEHSVLPDRLEVASWACVAAATNGKIFVRGARQSDLMTFLNKFRQVGGEFKINDEGIEFWRGHDLKAIAIETDVYPGFSTDYQQPFVVLLTQAKGASVIHETVYEKRFGFVEALNKMGAHIQIYRECLGGKTCRFGQQNHEHSAVITGPTKLKGAEIEIPDLRAGFSYVIAALVAEGESTLRNIHHIYRGYENFANKLFALEAEIVE